MSCLLSVLLRTRGPPVADHAAHKSPHSQIPAELERTRKPRLSNNEPLDGVSRRGFASWRQRNKHRSFHPPVLNDSRDALDRTMGLSILQDILAMPKWSNATTSLTRASPYMSQCGRSRSAGRTPLLRLSALTTKDFQLF